MPQFSVAPNDDIQFVIRYADENLLVVDKPAGVVTQPGKGHLRDSLLNGLFVQYGNLLQNLGEDRTWGLLHRLDKETSGLVLVALRTRAYDRLREQFENRLVKKTYWAIVWGTPSPPQGVIQDPIAEVVSTRKIAVIRRDGKQAITAYRVLQTSGDVSLVEARPKTGRLHQIRLHLAARGNQLLGDDIYGGKIKTPTVPRLCLHATQLSFLHPESGHRITVNCPWPDDLLRTAKRFGLQIPAIDSA